MRRAALCGERRAGRARDRAPPDRTSRAAAPMKRLRSPAKPEAAKPEAAKPDVLVVWDFDYSLIDENSDTFVVEKLDASGDIWREAERKLRRGTQWTALMDWCAGELHSAGHAPQAIREALAAAPMLDGALGAVAAARAAGAEQRILSDANEVYIETVLRSRELTSDFPVVVTNPAKFDEAGRLHIQPHQPLDQPHRCPNCPSNLCKGAVLQRWLDELSPARCVYVGDGGGDFCPATKLRPGDTLLARRAPHDSLLRKCRGAPSRVRARVVEWGGAADASGAALSAGVASALPE